MIACSEGYLAKEQFKPLARRFMLGLIALDGKRPAAAAEEVLKRYAVKRVSLDEARGISHGLIHEFEQHRNPWKKPDTKFGSQQGSGFGM